jgi:RNA polymerase sigma factor (sigma-70 family)
MMKGTLGSEEMSGAKIERFERLFRAHGRAVLAYARRRNPADDAQDVLADTFLTAWRRLDDVPEDALPWLLSVSRNLISNHRRSEGRRAALVQKLRITLGQRARLDRSATEPASLREAVLSAIASLPERQR